MAHSTKYYTKCGGTLRPVRFDYENEEVIVAWLREEGHSVIEIPTHIPPDKRLDYAKIQLLINS